MNKDFVIRTGKYAGETIGWLENNNPGYLAWIKINQPNMLKEIKEKNGDCDEPDPKFKLPPLKPNTKFWDDIKY